MSENKLLAQGYCEAEHPADGVQWVEIYYDGEYVSVYAGETYRDDIESLDDFQNNFSDTLYRSLTDYRKSWQDEHDVKSTSVKEIWPEEK